MSFSENKRFLAIVFALCLTTAVGAQNRPLYDQYQYNGVAINPAFTGSREVMSLAALYRTQWLKTDGAPSTFTFSGDFPLRNPKLALGLLFVNDRIDIYRQTGVYAAYAFRVPMARGKFSLGLQAGFDTMGEDLAGISTIEPDDPMFTGVHNRLFMPNAGAGMYYSTSHFFAGLSVPYLVTYTPSGGDSYRGRVALRDLMLYGGGIIPMNKVVKLKPAVLLRYNPNDLLFDLNLGFLLLSDDRVEISFTYRSTGVWAAMAAIRVNSQIFIGYAYDRASGMANITTGSHEIVLRYELRYRVKAVNPLYLK